jgi:hypothetical protein
MIPFTLTPVVGTGLHLEVNKEVTLRTLCMLAVYREDSALWITPFPGIFLPLLSSFGQCFVHSTRVSHRTGSTGNLSFVVLSVLHVHTVGL